MCSHAWSLSIRNHIFSAAITKDLSIFRFLFDTLDTSPNHPLHPGSAALFPFTIQRCFSVLFCCVFGNLILLLSTQNQSNNVDLKQTVLFAL